jgi:hypothetical protein
MIVSGAQPNETWQIGSFSDSDEDDPIEKMEDSVETSELKQLFSAIQTANSSLMKLSVVIRNTPARDDYLKASSRYNFDPRYDIGHVKEKYGNASQSRDWLIERLGKAITRRRQYLAYRKDHHGKLSRDWDELPKGGVGQKSPKTVTMTTATTFMERAPLAGADAVAEEGFVGSETSYEQTVFGDDAKATLRVPSHPNTAFEGVPFEFGEPFQCPYCNTEQIVKNRAGWKYCPISFPCQVSEL